MAEIRTDSNELADIPSGFTSASGGIIFFAIDNGKFQRIIAINSQGIYVRLDMVIDAQTPVTVP